MRSAERGLYFSQISVVLQAVRTAYSLSEVREQIRIREDSVQRLQALASAARIKREVGVADPEDVYRAEQNLKQAESNLVASKRSYLQLQDQLKTLMGLDQSEDVSVDTPMAVPALDIDRDQAEALALSQRLEMEQVQDDLREKFRLSRVAQDNIWPELNIIFDYSRSANADDFGRSLAMDRDSWGVSLVSSTDLFRTSEKIAYDQSLINVEQAKRAIQTQRDTIIREVKDAYRALEESHENIRLQQARMVNAARQLELSRIKFKYGMANNFDLLDAENVYTSAQQAHQTAIVDSIVGSYELQAALGILFQDMIPKPTNSEFSSNEKTR